MGSGGETGSCPVLGYKVTQSRSHTIALLVRAGHGGRGRAGTAAWHGLCPAAAWPGSGCLCPVLPRGSARRRDGAIFSHIISARKGICSAGKYKSGAWLPELLTVTYP